MKDPRSVFEDSFTEMFELFNKEQYHHCSHIAFDMIEIAVQLELKNEAFISQIFNELYSTMDMIDEHYDLPKEFKKESKSIIAKYLDNVISAYKNNKMEDQYDALQELHYEVRSYQYMAYRKYAHLHKPHKEEV